ncbi:MAG: hypothetical protein GF364_05850 [Candidatus Lokiarchaeota archaeon]|nr:hypothetical protein [Candidatus Lokiarchaeota archaeon]
MSGSNLITEQTRPSIKTIKKHKLKKAVLEKLREQNVYTMLDIEITRELIVMFGAREFKFPFIKKLRDCMFDLCIEGKIDAIITHNITKTWNLVELPDVTLVKARNWGKHKEKEESRLLTIEQGWYYSWNFNPCVRGVQKMGGHPEYILDTSGLRDIKKEKFNVILRTLRKILDSKKRVGNKLLWVLSEKRDRLPI